MKKGFFIILGVVSFITLFIYIYFVNSMSLANSSGVTNIYSLSNGDKICSALKSNSNFRIGIKSYYEKKSYLLDTSSCYGSTFYNSHLSNIKKGDYYEPWTTFGRVESSYTVTIDDVKVKDVKKNGRYSYFYINNEAQKFSETTGNLVRTATLKPGETVFLDIGIGDKELVTNVNKELRLTINYGFKSGDYRLDTAKTITYYLYSEDDIRYGPFYIEYTTPVNKYYSRDSNGSIKNSVYEYKTVSENLFKNVPNNIKITKIQVFPYELKETHDGAFRLYSLSLDLYNNGYKDPTQYIKVDNAENLTRHNIVDNMLREITVKWDVSPDSKNKLIVYYTDGRGPITFDGSSNNVYYGLGYTTVNVYRGTLNTFIGQTSKNKSKNGAYYSYNITDKYLGKEVSSNGTTHNKGEPINGDIYILNTKDNAEKALTAAKKNHKNLKNTNIEFLNNANVYFHGVSCSSSASAAYYPEVANTNYIASYTFFGSDLVEMVGGLSLTGKEVSDTLRAQGILNSSQNITQDIHKKYYSSIMRNKYTAQEIFNSYGLTLPGDMVVKTGHVRVASGMPYVECYDGVNTQKYTNNFCKNHGGINPSKSYVITTEGGTGFSYRGTSTSAPIHVLKENTGWTYTLDPKYTDLTNIDELYTNPKLMSTARPNLKYYFNELYDPSNATTDIDVGFDDSTEDEDSGSSTSSTPTVTKSMYISFRFKEMKNLKNNMVAKPTYKFTLDKSYSNEERNKVLYDFLKAKNQLKGTFFSNYMINAVRIEINNDTYYIYPSQTNIFSLYTDIKDENILNKLKSLNYNEYNEIRISFMSGPNIEKVKKEMNTDKDGFTEAIKITSPYVSKYDSNNYLKSLSISSGTIQFNKNTLTYNTNVSDNVNSITIDAVLDSNKASFVSGYGPRKVNVNYGENTFEIRVKAEDGNIRKYIIKVTREQKVSDPGTTEPATPTKNSDATLSKITLSNGNILFDPNIYEYSISVGNSVDKLDIKATPTNNKATVKISNNKLAVGKNTIKIVVTAENGNKKEYIINVTRANKSSTLSDNNRIKTINIEGYNISFSNDIVNYELLINDDNELNISIEMEDNKANYKISGNSNLTNDSVIKITTMSESGIAKDFNILIKKNNIEEDNKTIDSETNNTSKKYLIFIGIGMLLLIISIKSAFTKK